jgi:hypothetical protein
MVISENRQGFVDGVGEYGLLAPVALKRVTRKHLAISLC